MFPPGAIHTVTCQWACYTCIASHADIQTDTQLRTKKEYNALFKGSFVVVCIVWKKGTHNIHIPFFILLLYICILLIFLFLGKFTTAEPKLPFLWVSTALEESCARCTWKTTTWTRDDHLLTFWPSSFHIYNHPTQKITHDIHTRSTFPSLYYYYTPTRLFWFSWLDLLWLCSGVCVCGDDDKRSFSSCVRKLHWLC